MLGFSLDAWDWITFGTLFIVGIGVVTILVLMASLPGKIAIARNHPDAEAVQLMGYLGFLAVVPWMQAFIWAFKPTDIVDIRRFPNEERAGIAANIAKLKDAAGQTESPPAPSGTGDA